MTQINPPKTTNGASAPPGQNQDHSSRSNGLQDASPGGRAAPIAIVGMSCKFGGEATSPSRLWDLCTAGKDSWTPIPHDRFDAAGLYDERKGKLGRHSVQGGYFLKDIASFDAAFYNYTTDVANAMDPQIRLLLESVYEGVEDAGIPIQKLAGSNTSVFAGSFSTDYSDMTLRDPETMQPSYKTGNGIAMLSNRISHFYDLRGPSMTIDVGCSTGLVALHQACQSLRSGESDVSIVGSSLLCFSPDMFTAMSLAGVLGSSGKCFAWDERAEGYGRGEGVASLILKPLDAATRDGDNVLAVVRESGLNQDGKTPTITSPSMAAQVKLIQDVYRRANLDPADTGYVEAHMTGTPTGDPIEAEALARTFGKGRGVGDPVLVGSVKPNIGHTEPVSGLAAIIKTIFVLRHGLIPPNVNYEKPNPSIPLLEWRLKVPTALTTWPADKPRRASVNNFGYGGTNAHVILEEAPGASGRLLLNRTNGVALNGYSGRPGETEEKTTPHGRANGAENIVSSGGLNGHTNKTTARIIEDASNGHTMPHVAAHADSNRSPSGGPTGHTNGIAPGIPEDGNYSTEIHHNGSTSHSREKDHSLVYVLSAKDSVAIQQMNKNLAHYIKTKMALGTVPRPVDLAFTLAERKSRFPWLTAVRASSLTELASRLHDDSLKPARANKRPRLGFVFNGQGAQWHAMGRELIEEYPEFRHSLLAADRVLKDYGASYSLHEELLRGKETTRVHEIRLSQPLSVALQICLVDLLASWGIKPSAVTSHSSGEIAAAYAVGALSFQQALGVVYFRGELAQKHHDLSNVAGGMLAAGLSAEDAAKYVNESHEGGIVVVACHNSPKSVTLSGDMAALDQVGARLTEDGIFARKLNVPLAYHSHHMVAMAQDYTDQLRKIIPVPSVWTGALFASPVTGGIVTSPKVLTAEHFVRNLVSPVLFAQAFEQMCFSTVTSDGSTRPAGQEVNLDMVVEVGAHGTLSGPIRQIIQGRGGRSIPYVSCLQRNTNAVHSVQDAVCALLAQGCPVPLAAVNGHEHSTYVPELPSYAWNHGTQYWIESRLFREHRYKRFPPHELLGSPVAGTNRHTPTWRNVLRSSDIAWLSEHKLGGDTVLPGAGYVSMAIEAVRNMTDPSEETITGYRLREIDIANALVVPEASTSGVEIQITLRPCSDKELEHEGWHEFEIWSVSGAADEWLRHCRGRITAETVSRTEVAATKITMPPPRVESFFATGDSVRQVQVDSIFSGLRAMNLFHGPVFQNLIYSQCSGPRSITTLAISSVAAATTDDKPVYVLHPTTLDSLIQAAYVSIPDATQRQAMVVPRSIRHLYVPRHAQRHAGHMLTAFVNLDRADGRGATTSIVAVNHNGGDEETGEKALPGLELDGLYCQAVPLEMSDGADSETAALCSKTRWEMSIAYEVPEAFKVGLQIPLNDGGLDFERKLDRVSFNLIYDAVSQLSASGDASATQTSPRVANFYSWMKSVVTRGQAGELGPGSRAWSKTNAGLKQRLSDDMAAECLAGNLIVRVGQQLAAIVRGDVNIEDFLRVEGYLVSQYYETLPRLQQRSYAQLNQVVGQYAVTHSGSHVLEIGGRAGDATPHAISGFAARAEEGSSGILLGHYDFTHVSADWFEAAKEKCAPWESLVNFKTLDIHQDPVAQGFEAGSYDLVVASGAAMASPDLSRTLTHVRRLIKPGGKLVLVEATRARLDTQLVFGALPGLSEDATAANGRVVSVDRWDEMLRTSGFAGVEFEIADCNDMQLQATSVMLTTAVEDDLPPSYPTEVCVVHSDDTRPAQAWLDGLEAAISEHTAANTTVKSLGQVQPRPDVVYFFTPEMTAPFLDGMDPVRFDQLKALVVQGQGLLWLSRGNAITAEQPVYAQAAGFLRTARQEDTTKRYVSLDFGDRAEGGGPWSLATIPHILRVLQQSYDGRIDTADIEWEYAVQQDALHVPRVYPSPSQDRSSSETPAEPTPQMEPLWQQDRPLRWEVAGAGGTLSDLYFTDDELAASESAVPSGMVEIQTKMAGLNFRDVMVALGQIDQTRHIHDAAGIVTRLGKGTEASGLKVGDRVCGVLDGRFGTHPRAPWTSLVKIPSDMTWEEAATLPMVFLTSYICLFDLARLQPGERVLIHAGSGGVGQSAIMLAKHVGAEVFVTCSSETKRDLIRTRYGVDADHILSSRDSSFVAAIMAKTNNAGVDVVLNSLSGPLLKATWECTGRFGRFLEIGKVDMEAARRLDMSPLTRSVSIFGFDLTQYCAFNGQAVHHAWQGIMRLWESKAIRSVGPVTTYPIEEMETAMRRMQRGTHMGKLLLTAGPDSHVKVLTRSAGVARLDDPNSTYMVVGGVGGIGYALATWMMERGAQNILVVSRRAESHPQAPSLIAHGQTKGCVVAVKNCDVAQEDQLRQLLSDCASTMPPIRGVIQAAMGLYDTILERLTYEQWQGSTRPKVAGSLHLHRNLPGLDFFVMLSSVAGVIGNASQANYAAGNTFQDALARHRTAHGLPAVSIDLGAVGDVGVVAESGDGMAKRLERSLGSKLIPIGRVIRLVEAAVCDPFRQGDPDASQVITGIADYEHVPPEAAIKRDRRFSTMRLGNPIGGAAGGGGGAQRSPDEALKESLTAMAAGSGGVEAVTLVMGGLLHKLATLFNLVEDDIDTSSGLAALGVDSLVAVELRNWFSSVLRAKVTIFEILQTASVKEIAALVVSRSALVS